MSHATVRTVQLVRVVVQRQQMGENKPTLEQVQHSGQDLVISRIYWKQEGGYHQRSKRSIRFLLLLLLRSDVSMQLFRHLG
jgi:hypothetical protein